VSENYVACLERAMKGGLQSRFLSCWFEIPVAVYAIVGLTTVALFAVANFFHSPVNAEIGLHGMKFALETTIPGPEKPRDAMAPSSSKSSPKDWWVFQNRPLMASPRRAVIENSQKETNRWVFENNPITLPPTFTVADNTQREHEQLAATKPTRWTYGYYFARVMAQGDAFEGEFELEKRPCHPLFRMPLACYYPQKDRWKFPIHDN
jgi:hypothetical protein